MSTHIKTLTGRYEIGNPIYSESKISITRFCGGKDNGSMLQLTIHNEDESSYVQLTQDQVKDLQVILNNSFDFEKYPSE